MTLMWLYGFPWLYDFSVVIRFCCVVIPFFRKVILLRGYITLTWLYRPFGWLYGNVPQRAATHRNVRIRVWKCIPPKQQLTYLCVVFV